MNDRQFMEKACYAALHSTCLKRKVGAVIVQNETIVAEGFNGGEDSFFHCTSEEAKGICYWKKKAYELANGSGIARDDEKFQTIKKEARLLCLSTCAERRAIYQVFHCKDLKGAAMYCTTYPCPACAKMIRLAGISKVYYMNDFDENRAICIESKRILEEAGIEQYAMELEGSLGEIGKRTDYEYRE